MPVPLLATKLHAPAMRPRLVSRPRLLARLQDGPHCPLTLISAPAGFGKTTLVTEWQARLGPSARLAWLSLDSEDNDLTRFLAYLVAALTALQTDLGETWLPALQSPQPPPPQAVLTALINALDSLAAPGTLVLDDYHVITAPAIHAALTFLLDHQPPRLRIVVLTRADPPLALPRLRARGQLNEIRAAELRFTADEAAEFLNRVMGLDLPAGDVAALGQRTEGWIAGLQLAALSLQGHAPSAQTDFIATFTGGHHYVADYLVTEVLNRQPEAVTDFLLQTSILDRLTGALYDALTGRSDGQAMLEQLEQANLFVIPLDAARHWYRYHPLFAELLRQRLQAAPAPALAELHRRASAWHASHGDADQAITHALAARDWPRAVALMETAGLTARHQGRVARLKSWLDALPKSAILLSPRLRLNYGWAMVLAGQFDAGEQALADIGPIVQDDPALKVDWLAAQVWAARGRGELTRAVELAQQALAYDGLGDVQARCLLMLSLSVAYWHLGLIEATATAAQAAVQLAEQAGNWHARAMMLARLALVQAAQGHLRQAEQTYLQALRRQVEAPAWAGGGAGQHYLAALYYEWNDLTQAEAYARQGLAYSQLTGHTEFHINSYRQLAYIHQARGEARQALEALHQADQVARERHLPHCLWGPLTASRVQIALAQGNLADARYWLEQVQGGYGAAFHYLKLPLERVKLALAEGDPAHAAALLADCEPAAAQHGLRYAQIEILILKTLAASAEAQGLACLAEALRLARPEGYRRVFVDQGKALVPWLRRAATQGLAPGYVAELLAAMADEPGPGQPAQPLLEPLSQRELEVLKLVVAGLSNRAIAAELILATGTVKKHLSNIFGKLNVQTRTECVARAHDLRLL